VTGHQHTFVLTRVEEPTCEIAGYSVYTCDCGEEELRDAVEATGHSFGPGKKVVLCTEPGYTEYICIHCGFADRQNVTEAPGHDNYLVQRQEHSCTQDGFELYRCRRCDVETKENEQKANGHTDFEWVQIVAPGVGVVGEEFRQCTTCMESESRPCKLVVTSIQEAQGQEKLCSYLVFVGTETTPRALRYIINDYSFAKDMFTVYSEDGLLVSYTDKSGKSQTTTLPPLEEAVLNIDTEGKIVDGAYPPSEPTEPTTEPTVPTTQPVEPTTQPTEPTTQPTVPTVPTEPIEPTEPSTQPTEPTTPAE
jgi:hypothetical protein